MPIASLNGEYSCGSFGKEAKEFIDFLHESGFRYWQVLPFTMVDDCNSPYQSYSAFAGNLYYINLDILKEEGLLTEDEIAPYKQITPYAVEYDRLRRERFSILLLASKRCKNKDEVKAFIENDKNLKDFSLFMARKEANGGKCWSEWETDEISEEILFAWQFIQYKFHTQWANIKEYANKKDVKIIGDIPIYISYDSCDLYNNKEYFKLDKENIPSAVAGVPPDAFTEDGQLWGNPLYDWDKMKETGYEWWQKRLEAMFNLFDGVRIDHFRGFESYYSVPYGEKTAKNGKWVKGPGMDIVEVIKKAAKDKLVIAEDLGCITKEVRALVDESGFMSMKVMQFGFIDPSDNAHLPHNYEANSVAYTGTHDNNTLLGYVWELSENDRQFLMDYVGYKDKNWDKIYDDILAMMLRSHSDLVIFPIQDLLCYGADTRINTPGKAEGNWTFRVTKEQINSIDKAKLKKWITLYKRG